MQKTTTLLAFISCFTFGFSALAQTTPSEPPTPAKVADDTVAAPSAASAAIEAAVATPSPAESVKAVCRSHFSTMTQTAGASACLQGATSFQKDGLAKSNKTCLEKFPFSNRDELSCRTGVGIAQELARSPELDKNKLKTCQELYPVVTALDAYFQEACLAGAYSVAPNAKPDIKLCHALSDDRSFIGPCVSGMSAAVSTSSSVGSVGEQHKACLQVFDKTQFHTGYRACINSRALFVISEESKTSVIKQCDLFTSNNKSETERAACIVGASIAKATAENNSLPLRFKTCGEGKASYQDRGYLTCLTAASLLDFMDKSKARGACKTVFSSRKTNSRGQCSAYIDKF